jgi:N-acetylglucosaminyldiphosphoundecaprenol N-acetyl-beta-D-mannosaminyltransferase
VTNKATLATADGVPLIWASKVLGGPNIHGRASGPDILEKILLEPNCQHLRHFFFGSTPEVLEGLKAKLIELAPNAKLAGFYSPPKRAAKAPKEPMDKDELEECRIIDEARPHIVWVGLGAPKQEIWMYRSRQNLKAPVTIGVGAAFDFLAGNKKRAPMWMQKGGLEWAYRFMQEPTRLASRYLKTNPVFVAAVAKEALLRRR